MIFICSSLTSNLKLFKSFEKASKTLFKNEILKILNLFCWRKLRGKSENGENFRGNSVALFENNRKIN